MNIIKKLPEDLAIKIYAEYAPAPDPDGVFLRVFIMQQVDMKIWISMVTYVAMDGTVTPIFSRTYPRELENALKNCAKSLEKTLLKSDIQFRINNLVKCCIISAGLIGPLTKRQHRCNWCHLRKFHSFSIKTKFQVPLHGRRPDNTTNFDYLQHLVQHAMGQVKSKNRISVFKTDLKESEAVLWILLQKPRFPISKVLCKSYVKH